VRIFFFFFFYSLHAVTFRNSHSRSNNFSAPFSVAVEALESLEAVHPQRPPETAEEWAVIYAGEIKEMRRMLADCQVAPLPGARAGDAELLRFAAACGLLSAASALERGQAIERGVRRVADASDWLELTRLLPDSKLRRWERLVAWRSADAAGRPILLVRAGRALQLCKPNRYDDFACAILSQVDRGVRTRLAEGAPGAAERMVVVLDCRGASSVGVARCVPVIKRVAAALNAHYPDRLHRIHLLELPSLARWVVQAVLPLLHPSTRDKVVMASAEDADLPVTVALLTKRRSQHAGLSRSMSDLSLPASDVGTPGVDSPSLSRSPSDAAARVAWGLEEMTPSPRTTGPGPADLAAAVAAVAAGLPQSGAGDVAAVSSRTEPSSHFVMAFSPSTASPSNSSPAMLSPQSTLDSGEVEEAEAAAAAAGMAAEGGFEGSGRLSAGPLSSALQLPPLPTLARSQGPESGSGPWAGLASLLTNMLPAMATPRSSRSRSRSPREARTSGLSPATDGSGSARLRTPGTGTPITPSRRGGLRDLPARPRSSPKKSSLRRLPSCDVPPPTPGRTGSFPLRRQSSVTWAQDLERVVEISRSPPRSGMDGRGDDGAAAAQSAALMLLLLMAAAMVQRVLLAAGVA
jgi:hypothetical protein